MVGRSLTALCAVAGSAGVWAWAGERRRFVLRRRTVPVLPPGSAPVRVLHVSDLHLSGGGLDGAWWAGAQRAEARWVAGLASLRPDLVVNTGDFFGHESGLPAIREALGPLLQFPGVFVLGSNDLSSPTWRNPLRYLWRTSKGDRARPPRDLLTSGRTQELRSFLLDGGWKDVDNGFARVRVGQLHVDVLGTGDAHVDRDDLTGLRARASSAGRVSPTAALRLGVTHAPYQRVLDALSEADADLMLAGHTHGGQVRVPGYGALTVNCDLPRALGRGLHPWPHAGRAPWLNVSAGVGTAATAPVRFACRPEASLLTLVAREG